MGVWTYTLVSVFFVSLLSIASVAWLSVKKIKHVLILFVSFSAGAFFGDVFFHLLPATVDEFGFTMEISLVVLSGILFSFVIEKFIHWRHCHVPTSSDHPHPVATMNLVGDSVHNFIDGVLIGASYLANTSIGIATTIAVVFHEIPQEIGDFGVMLHGGFTKKKALLFNFLTAMTAVLGAVIVLLVNKIAAVVTSFLIPFAAGTFIYIAAADLIPEIHKETRVVRSVLQLVFFLAGVAVMGALLFLE